MRGIFDLSLCYLSSLTCEELHRLSHLFREYRHGLWRAITVRVGKQQYSDMRSDRCAEQMLFNGEDAGSNYLWSRFFGGILSPDFQPLKGLVACPPNAQLLYCQDRADCYT